MKILSTSTFSSGSLTTGTALSGFPVANIETDQPQERLIGAAKTITLRVAVSGASDSIFLDGWLADSGNYDLDAAGSPTSLSAAQLQDRFGFKPWGQDMQKRKKPLFISGLSFSSTVDLTLATSVDVKDTPMKGASIAKWAKVGAATGNFTDASDNIINVLEHGQVLLGGWVDSLQIEGITGDGTASGAITLSSDLASGSITAINLPVQLGVVKVGTSSDFSNPQGLTRDFTDFSTVRTGTTGFRQVTKRGVSQIITAQGIYTQAQADVLVGIAAAHRGEPVAVQLLEGMTTERDSEAVFGAISIPQDTFATPTGTYRNLSFTITEVL